MSDYTPRPASDYAPSTEEVRRVVMSLNNYLDEPRAAELDGELFDLWLTEVKVQEAKAERERIMKLVQKQLEADPYNSMLRTLEAGISQMPVKGETE